MTTETLPFHNPEQLELDDALQKAALIFDEVAFLGNALPLPQTIHATLPGHGSVNISTFPQKFERAELAFVKLDCIDANGVPQGTVFLAGSGKQTAATGEWNWSMTSRPGQISEPSGESNTLARTFLVPLAKAWDELGTEAQDQQIDEWRRAITDRKSRRIARSLRHLRRPHAA